MKKYKVYAEPTTYSNTKIVKHVRIFDTESEAFKYYFKLQSTKDYHEGKIALSITQGY